MRAPASQRGFLLIVAVVLIAVGAAMAAIIVTLTAGSGQGGGLHVNATQAFFVAESGIERALYGYTRQGAACTALTYNGSVAISGVSGSYSTTGTAYAPAATALSANINAATTVIPVNSVAGYATHGRIMIGAEAIHYTGTSTSPAVCGGGAPACFIGATRGTGGTAAAAHSVGNAVIQNQCLIDSVGSVDNARRTVSRAVFRGAGAMAVYVHENNLGVPYYRFWDGAAWGVEATATGVGSEIRYIMVKSARTRDEYIMVTQSANGEIRAQIWNGTAWTSNGVTTGATLLLGTINNNGDRDYRAFDVEYESASDRAMVVYRNGNNADPDFRLWNGTAWTGTATVVPNATANRPRWIELAADPNPLLNDMVLFVANSGRDVHGTHWNGVAWDDMGAGLWDNDTAATTTKIMDVVYERDAPGRAVFVWADDTSCNLSFRTWDPAGAGTLGGITPFAIPGGAGCADQADWVRLAADPFSSSIMLGVQDQDNDLNTCLWIGSPPAGWNCADPPHIEHSTDVESGVNRSFDIVFASDPNRVGEAWLVWGALAGGGTNIWRRPWNPATSTWGAIDVFLGPDMCYPAAVAHPNTGVILVGNYEDANTGDISATQLVNGVWSGSTLLWNSGASSTLDCQGGDLIHERVSIATQRGGLNRIDWLEVFR